jgi:hypothetical protein
MAAYSGISFIQYFVYRKVPIKDGQFFTAEFTAIYPPYVSLVIVGC